MMNGSSNPFGGGTANPYQQQQQQAHSKPPSEYQMPDQAGGRGSFTTAAPPQLASAHHNGMPPQNGYHQGTQFAQPNSGSFYDNPYGAQPSPPTQPPAGNPFQLGNAAGNVQNGGGALVVSNAQSNPYAVTYSQPSPHHQQQAAYPGAPPQAHQAPWQIPPQQQQQFQLTPAAANYVPPPTMHPVDHTQRPPPERQSSTRGSGPLVAAPLNQVDSFRSSSIADPPGQKNATPTIETSNPPAVQLDERPNEMNKPTPNDETPRNRYAEELAQAAPPGASPLPKAEMVRKSGYVLSRVSFRTIVMKKWKQAYWVQYGPHTMLWFRSQADFDDWLNNPYHQQSERNYLIKLAVNFVHDLYKPNVRGYQVTQCRTKAYGNKMVRQFKLERWMDYGPTIAAAFGSYNPAEVDALREAVVECMRNTPLNNGIRATGAVRRPPEEQSETDPSQNDNNPKDPPPQKFPVQEEATESVAEEADLLDVNNWDDVPTDAQSIGPYGQPNNYGQPQQHIQQHHQQQPVQYPAYGAPPAYAQQQQQPYPAQPYAQAPGSIVPSGQQTQQWALQQQPPYNNTWNAPVASAPAQHQHHPF